VIQKLTGHPGSYWVGRDPKKIYFSSI
jgi:hypothetical protein